ncbi:hypothetical protein OKA04_10540 [Luteolibacter flavescens]|uniref:SGNH/GDSL hydrolase family protein n=1 Tax=Luteolibacter flavescens TaxID=1859460 RepID=A0ABT3FNM0_9BACT|nr:hypothetical protein [Luteolibacter flavescens]MCW1885166.1 hypothetical protein [Luteolibacter flavescens]
MLAYLIPFVLALAACFGIQALGLHAMGGRTSKSESNYFSSLGRIQAGTVGTPQVMLLGSSITGRLPDRSQGFEGFANMGCDGGSAVDALRAMDHGFLPTAPVLVIEANTLHLALSGKPSEVGAAMEKAWFQAGMRTPSISSYARPSAFAYSFLLAKKIGGFGDPAADEDLQVTSMPAMTEAPVTVLLENQHNLIGELVPLIQRLRAKGCRIVFAWLPPGRGDGSPLAPWMATLIAESGSEWWDLGTEASSEWVVLTDGVHMAAPSASRTVRSLRKALNP